MGKKYFKCENVYDKSSIASREKKTDCSTTVRVTYSYGKKLDSYPT